MREENLKNTDTGLLSLYQDYRFPNATQSDMKGIDFVDQMMMETKRWKKDIMPRYDFDYFLERI